MKRIRNYVLIIGMFCLSLSLSAFDDGFVFGMRVRFLGSATDPCIGSEDQKKMMATFLKGNVGFIIQGGADLTYIFDVKKYFNMKSAGIFGGLGLGGYIEIGQGYSGQASGTGMIVKGTETSTKEEVVAFVNVYFTPAIHFGASLKTYLLSNRFVLGMDVGCKLIADPTPVYDQYSNDETKIESEVGTIIVTDDMKKKMNPFAFEVTGSMEYIQPILNTTELVLGGYMAYAIYRPGYVSMPPKLEAAAIAGGFEPRKMKLKSFYLNSLDFGITLGINFKVNP